MTFRLCGIQFHITFLFVAFLAFIISLKAPANVFITVISSVFHEIGHLSIMMISGCKPKIVKFEMIGMNIIRQEDLKINTKSEIAISLGGPIMNCLVLVISCVILCFYDSQLIMTCACINLILMIFNLLPIKSLDGGAVLYFILSRFFENSLCSKILNITSILFISIMYLWAVYVLVITKYNFSLIIIAIFLTISLFQNNDY